MFGLVLGLVLELGPARMLVLRLVLALVVLVRMLLGLWLALHRSINHHQNT